MPMMDACLLHARKFRNDDTSKFEWQIIHPEKRGICILVNGTLVGFSALNIDPDIMVFLTDIVGKGGPWQGWFVSKLSFWIGVDD